MRFRLGLAIGFGAGYVLGTKAGRERYDQIMATAKGLIESERGQQVSIVAHKVVEQAGQAVGAARETVGKTRETPTPDPAPVTPPGEPEVAEVMSPGEGNGKL